jgi:AcrR family transcriptional regulator
MGRTLRGRGAHHDERRREIADAVLAVVADAGLAAVSLNEVAAKARVSAGRVQHYFRSKPELIGAAFERGNALAAARIRDVVGEQDLDAADPRAVLTTVLTQLLPHDDATRAHMRVRQFFNAQALADPVIADQIRDRYDAFHRDLADLVARIDPSMADRAEQTAVRLAALTEGLAYYVLIDACSTTAARDLLLAELANLLD